MSPNPMGMPPANAGAPMMPPMGMGGPPPMPPGGMMGGAMMPQGDPAQDPMTASLIQMLLSGALSGMAATATDPNTLLQSLMAQQGPAPMMPPPAPGPMTMGM